MSTAVPFVLGAPGSGTPLPAALDRIGARLANGLQDVFAQLGLRLTVQAQAAIDQPFATWKASLPAHVGVARYRATGWRGGLLLSMSPRVVVSMVDACYGGDGSTPSARARFSPAELRFVARLAEATRPAIEAAWRDIASFDAQYVGLDTAATDIVFGRANDPVIVQRFTVERHEPIEIVYPAGAVRALPGLRDDAQPEEEDANDPRWKARLADAVMQMRLPVRTVIARPTLPLDRLMRLAPGDVIPVCLPAQVPVTVAGRLLAHGTIGEANGRAAIRISKLEHGGLLV